MRFDGKQTSEQLLSDLSDKIRAEGLDIQIATILVGNDRASELYTKLKRRAAEKIGITMHVYTFSESDPVSDITQQIDSLNRDQNITGIMIQLPLPEKISQQTDKLIAMIKDEKDIDGMKQESKFVPATVRGIVSILKISKHNSSRIAVVGSEGSVGKALMKEFNLREENGFDIGDDLDTLKNFEVIISATGQAGLIKPEMIKDRSVLIDVGAPKPEIDTGCYDKASFYTPVPGGVGPMTIASLMQNAVDAFTHVS